MAAGISQKRFLKCKANGQACLRVWLHSPYLVQLVSCELQVAISFSFVDLNEPVITKREAIQFAAFPVLVSLTMFERSRRKQTSTSVPRCSVLWA